MEIEFKYELEIDDKTSKAIVQLLEVCFDGGYHNGRGYFKQLPHYRLIAKENGKIIGHIGMDYRVMNLNDQAIKILGVIDLCVDPKMQGRGVGTKLMQRFESIAKQFPKKVDFLFLVTDTPKYYERLGYQNSRLEMTWLKIHEHQTLGVGKETISDAFFMVKTVSNQEWKDGTLDMLGYMY